jgi:hypothetical protein
MQSNISTLGWTITIQCTTWPLIVAILQELTMQANFPPPIRWLSPPHLSKKFVEDSHPCWGQIVLCYHLSCATLPPCIHFHLFSWSGEGCLQHLTLPHLLQPFFCLLDLTCLPCFLEQTIIVSPHSSSH